MSGDNPQKFKGPESAAMPVLDWIANRRVRFIIFELLYSLRNSKKLKKRWQNK
jgi:hypothetical protein